jgi:hypothetical protein
MPSKSQAQNRAMRAAAEGKSTLGIPQKVGQDFVQADQGRQVGDLPKRKSMPGRSKQDKHSVIKRGESFDHKDLIGKWSAR